MAIDLTTIAAGSGGFVLNGQDAGDASGFSVASAGDVNGDGFADLIIGAPFADGVGDAKADAGGSYVVFGKASGWGAAIDLTTIAAGTGGFVIHGQDAGDRSGFSVASAGDVNGDGFGDVIIGAYGADAAGNAKSDAGESYVVFGKASGWGTAIDLADVAAGTGGFVILGQDAGDLSGYSVASAGDLNGDGFADLIIGARAAEATSAQDGAGKSYVVFGKASGWGLPVDLTTIAAGTGGFVILGQDADDKSGFSVASAGDVNGDGFADLLIGALGADAAGNAKPDAGESYVVFGKASGWGAAIDLATIAAGTGGFVIHGQDDDDASGLSVASAGDVNGDGFADLFIGAYGGDAAVDAKPGAGESYVVFGKASGWGGAIDLTSIAAGTGGFVILGQDADDASGYSVASAGDVNGDGFDDLIIGAKLADAAGNAKDGAGDSYVVFGKGSGWGGAIDLVTIAAGTGGFVIHGQDAGDQAGWSVAAAGDVNGDGFDDVFVGALSGAAAGNAKDGAGESYVIFGRDFTGSVTHAGTAANEMLTGSATADVIVAGQGRDTILGNGGNDALKGGAGNDRIVITDLTFLRVDGGSGTDTLALAGSGLTLDLAAVPDTKLQGIEAIEMGTNTLRVTALEVLNLSDSTNTLRVTASAGSTLLFDDAGWVTGATAGGFTTYTNGQASLVLQRIALPIELVTIAAGTGGFVIHGEEIFDGSGFSVASTGDLNGDGFDDLIIGAATSDGAGNANVDAGDNYVVFGKASGWGGAIDLADVAAGTGGFVIHGQDDGDLSGLSVASAGDVNGDGFDDLIIGAPFADPADNTRGYAGESYVVFGKASGWGGAIDLTDVAAGTGGFAILGQDAGDGSGYSVASAGDLNGDGFDDLIIGAPYGDAAGNAKDSAGESYVVFGKAGGWGGAIDLATIAAGTGGFVILGQDDGDEAGYSVASAGDVNGDGFDDLIIGARAADSAGNAREDAGESYVVFGKASGWGAAVDLATIAAGTGGFVILGQDAGDASGYAVASAGDVNGDGFGDLIIGAAFADSAGNAKDRGGESYVVFGKAGGWGAPVDLVTVAAGTGGFVILGQDAGDRSGYSAASAGDVNGDGFDDLIIGARYGDAAGNAKLDAGDSYVVFGKASGWGGAIDLATIAAGTGGFVILGQDAGDLSGGSVASAGDLDGDGFDDLIIGARRGDAAGNAKDRAGDSYVIFGRDFTAGVVTHAGTAANEALTGSAAADVIVAGQGDDTILGNGSNDALKGGAGNDRIAVSDLTFLRVDGGSGIDTLVLAGSALTLDLATIPDTKLQGIEAIEIGTNTLRVTALEVLNLSDSTNTLRVTAGAGATLLLDDAGWVTSATAGGFTTYSNGRATVLTQITPSTGGADTLGGTSGIDIIDALGGDDLVRGLDGNDSLIGGPGKDTLEGGAGDDSYTVDAANDVVVEAVGGGNDTVFAGVTYSLAAGQEIEALVLTGARNISGTGNEFANSITGNIGDNVLSGGGQGDSLAGGEGADTLNGGGADDTLVGGAGTDSLIGGGGGDYFAIDALDTIVEAADGGIDTVEVGFSYTLAATLEQLVLTGGTAALTGTGNAANNAIIGNEGNNVLTGDVGNDTMLGGAGRDTLLGGAGSDSLDGGGNPDSLIGGDGDDTYVLVVGSDTIVETGGTAGGIDTVIVAGSYTLLADVENLAISGGSDAVAIGNGAANRATGNGGANLLSGLEAADTLIGDKGNDTLLGWLGADALTGGKGKDAFRFSSASEGGDTITDYAGKDDRFEVSAGGFGGGLVDGVTLTALQYVEGAGAVATQANAQFLYDTAAKTLSWDADGTGAGAAVLIATFASVKNWGIGEISVIA